jgi:2-dehydro-3-deoxyphosphogluconate aldolase / (4S)-4-hydroxy-2-oxoglutarate aldolase
MIYKISDQLPLHSKYSASALNSLQVSGAIPVLNYGNTDYWSRVIDGIYSQGVRVVEYAHTRDVRSLRLFKRLVELCDPYTDLQVGAATVFNQLAARHYIEAGAKFISSPFLYTDMAETCHRSQVLWIPGCTTIEDIIQAKEAGAQVVSLVSASYQNSRQLISFARDHAHIHFIPSNGLQNTSATLSSWIQTGALCIRIVVPIFPRQATDSRHWMQFEQDLFSAIASVNAVRNSNMYHEYHP